MAQIKKRSDCKLFYEAMGIQWKDMQNPRRVTRRLCFTPMNRSDVPAGKMCGLTISQGDFVCASIEAELKEEVYVEIAGRHTGDAICGHGRPTPCVPRQPIFLWRTSKQLELGALPA